MFIERRNFLRYNTIKLKKPIAFEPQNSRQVVTTHFTCALRGDEANQWGEEENPKTNNTITTFYEQ
jgi:hypothetical protein